MCIALLIVRKIDTACRSFTHILVKHTSHQPSLPPSFSFLGAPNHHLPRARLRGRDHQWHPLHPFRHFGHCRHARFCRKDTRGRAQADLEEQWCAGMCVSFRRSFPPFLLPFLPPLNALVFKSIQPMLERPTIGTPQPNANLTAPFFPPSFSFPHSPPQSSPSSVAVGTCPSSLWRS